MTRSFGELLRNEDGYQVRFERVFPHSAELVWEALTDPERLSDWFRDTRSERAAGGSMTIFFRDGDPVACKILTYEPRQLYEFLWREGDTREEMIRCELHQEGHDRCRVVFTHGGFKEEDAVRKAAAWHMALDDLRLFLEGALVAGVGSAEEEEEQRDLEDKYGEIWEAKFATQEQNLLTPSPLSSKNTRPN